MPNPSMRKKNANLPAGFTISANMEINSKTGLRASALALTTGLRERTRQ